MPLRAHFSRRRFLVSLTSTKSMIIRTITTSDTTKEAIQLTVSFMPGHLALMEHRLLMAERYRRHNWKAKSWPVAWK